MKIFESLGISILILSLCMLFLSTPASADQGNNHHNTTTTNVTTNQSAVASMSAEQNNDIRIGGNAPGMGADAYDCNIEARSYSILIWSYGRSKCEKGSIVWRDIYSLVHYASVLGLDDAQLKAAIQRLVCSDRKMRKVVGTCPAKVRVVVQQREMH